MFRFRLPVPDDAAMLLDWRTRPDVTRWMFTDVTHGVAEQRAWLERCDGRRDFRHFVIQAEGQDVGYLSFAGIDRANRRCTTGHYFADAAERRRWGAYTHAFIMDYCFEMLGLHKVVNSFMAGNTKVLKLQRLLHYRPVGVHRDHVFKDGRWHDVHVYEMLASDWAAHPHLFPSTVTLASYDPWLEAAG